MAHLLGAQAIGLEYPNSVVLDSAALGIGEGDRIGVVGRNGGGKSSLLRILAGTLDPTEGLVTRRGGLRIGVLEQDDALDADATVGRALVGEAAEHEWASDPKIRDVIAGLVGDLDWQARVGTLSGGQRRRLGLAALLIGEWDVIMLDEPTNHLDVEGIAWLARHLKNRWPKNVGGLLVVTHDRWFLDEVATSMWEVHDGVVEPFEGGYAAYVLQRVERDRIAAAAESKRQNLMRKELAWLRRGAPARTSKPRFRIEAANRLIADVPPVRDSVKLTRMAVSRLGKDVVDLEDAGVRYGDRDVLREITWRIAPGERTAILGANGAGKSTLLRVLAALNPKYEGEVLLDGTDIHAIPRKSLAKRLAILPQGLAAPPDLTVEALVDYGRYPYRSWRTISRSKEDREAVAQALAETRLEAMRTRQVMSLSGGERQRAWIAMALARQPEYLLLDEPTAYLDIAHQLEVMEIIKRLNREHAMTVIMVLHDINHALQYADEIAVIKDRQIFSTGTPHDVLNVAMLAEVFGVRADIFTNSQGAQVLSPVSLVR